MIVGTCGFCSTGSSAVSDYLSEFECTQVIDEIEFTFTYLPDGLEDLFYHTVKRIVRDDSCCMAIPRFKRFMDGYKKNIINGTQITATQFDKLNEDFLNSIINLRWRGSRRSDFLLDGSLFRRYFGQSIMTQRVIPFLNKKFHKCVDLYPYRELEVSVGSEQSVDLFKKYVKGILKCAGADFSKILVIDQAFIGNDPEASFFLYDDPYAIVVDRDPRDNFIFAKEFLYKKGKFMPTDNVKEFGPDNYK